MSKLRSIGPASGGVGKATGGGVAVNRGTKLFEVTEHRARRYRHRPTGEVIAAALPDAVTRRFGEKLLVKIKRLFRGDRPQDHSGAAR